MHFSILETREIKESNSQTYMTYSIYINGVRHCDMRYSQLYTLNEQLKQVYGAESLPMFPPKKLFPLSQIQVEERRSALEKYLQRIGQNIDLVNSPVLRRFLLSAQTKTSSNWYNEGKITVWLLNNTQVTIETDCQDSADDVLQRVCDRLRIADELVQYFSLFIQKLDEDDEYCLVYLLQDFQNPLMTLKNMPGRNRIILRKSFWDITNDVKLMSDKTTLNLLYIQTAFDIQNGWIIPNSDIKDKLLELQNNGAKRELLETARTLKYYGYLRFPNCTCDYPEPRTEAILSVGFKDFIITVKSNNDAEEEYSFKIVRIRSWKITQLMESNTPVQLSFEYLLAKNKLQWITIISQYAYLVSVCLQAIVDELMIKRTGAVTNNKNGNSHAISCQTSNISVNGQIQKSSCNQDYIFKKGNPSKKMKQKFSTVSLRSPHTVSFIANDSFENIRDDDL